MNTYTKLPEIRKDAFIKAREKLGLSTKELGGMACLSTRQIEQIENGETSSFYGAQIKFTAAKKVAKLLDLSDEDAFEGGVVKPEPQGLESAKEVSKAEPPKTPAKEKVSPANKGPVQEISQVPASTAAKTGSQKKLFLGLSVAAALVFSIVNLQPLFFADKPQEVVVIKEELVEPAPVPAVVPVEVAPAPTTASTASTVVAATPVADTAGACPAEEAIISYKPVEPRKPADMVYVQSKSKQVVCVIDGSGKIQNKSIEPGVGTSFYGRPPFKVLTPGVTQVDVFFQGAKVRVANLNSKTIILEPAELVAPGVERTDSQLR
ncbi:helix-turn-helix transcriptional regulator [Polynucleobacter sinensis]|uniref:helix-turn-helix transcriptional regulator n=1 Tax=Polynucleobacter sinensis TaxID=1743157 RepID=UPI0007830B38|nr:helix-turn-helix transcriptional regulator [Polynucleobacter sinensis]